MNTWAQYFKERTNENKSNEEEEKEEQKNRWKNS